MIFNMASDRRDCETQLVMLMEDLSRNANEGKQTDLNLLDFSKGFDKISLEKLLLKLQHCGVHWQVLLGSKHFCQTDHRLMS